MEGRQLAIGDLVRSCLYGIPLCLLLTYHTLLTIPYLPYLPYLPYMPIFMVFFPSGCPLEKRTSTGTGTGTGSGRRTADGDRRSSLVARTFGQRSADGGRR